MKEILDDNKKNDDFLYDDFSYDITENFLYKIYPFNTDYNSMEAALNSLNEDVPKEKTTFFTSKKTKDNENKKSINEEENNNEPEPYTLEHILGIFKRNFDLTQYEFIYKNINFKKGNPKDLYLEKVKKHNLSEDFLDELIVEPKGDSSTEKKRGRKTQNVIKFEYHDKN